MTRSRCLRFTTPALLCTVALVAAACGGGGHSPAPGTAQTPAPQAPAVTAQFPGFSALPQGADDAAQPRAVSMADNIETGSQAVQSSQQGVFVLSQSRLGLGPRSSHQVAWAVWRWGAFPANSRPQTLLTNLDLTSTDKFWLLLANYGTNRWELVGQEGSSAQSFDFDSAQNYVSPNGNVYVALLTMDSNVLTVNTLDLQADDDITPPAAPTGLTGQNVLQHSAQLKWIAPPDNDLDHYELYQTPTPTAAADDPQSLLISDHIPNTDVGYALAPLQAATSYCYRIRAVDHSNNKSLLSVAAQFTTQTDKPPVPAYTYSPTSVMKNEPITFDPSTTVDPDDPPSNLTLFWDWNDDGIDDTVSSGLAPIAHTFHQQGLTTVKLTVYDGTIRVATTQSLNVQPYTFSSLLGSSLAGASSSNLNLVTGTQDYATSRIAEVVQSSQGTKLLWYQAGAWSVSSLTQFNSFALGDIAFGPGKLGLLLVNEPNFPDDVTWQVVETTDGTNWNQTKSGTLSGDGVFGQAAMSYAANGRLALAFSSAVDPTYPNPPDYHLTMLHEKANGTWLSAAGYSSAKPWTACAAKRNNTQSVFVYGSGGNIIANTLTDAVATPVTEQSGTVGQLKIGIGSDPADDSHVFWDIPDSLGVRYGDNFGTANGSNQYVNFPDYLTRQLVTFFGGTFAGDNQSAFSWADIASDDETYLRSFSTVTGTTAEVEHGVGICGTGFGGAYSEGAASGQYVGYFEPRNGVIQGCFVSGATILRSDTPFTPAGGGYVDNRSQAFTTPQDGLCVLTRQQAPTAILSSTASFGGTLTTQPLGVDTWAYPDCAAPDAIPGEILLGSIYYSDGTATNDLILNRFAPGATVGTHVLTLKKIKQAYMTYSPKSSQTMLVCLADDSPTLTARLWTGTTWGPPATIYASAVQIGECVLRARPDGEWGVAWDDYDSNVSVAETLNGAWQAPTVISTAKLDFFAGSLDMEYAPGGDTAFTVERNDAQDGVFLGLRPAGQTMPTWEMTVPTKGFNSDSIEAHWLPTGEVIVTFNVNVFFEGGGLRLAAKSGQTWSVTSLPFYLKGDPLASAMDQNGTIAFAGEDNSSGQGTVCYLNW